MGVCFLLTEEFHKGYSVIAVHELTFLGDVPKIGLYTETKKSVVTMSNDAPLIPPSNLFKKANPFLFPVFANTLLTQIHPAAVLQQRRWLSSLLSYCRMCFRDVSLIIFYQWIAVVFVYSIVKVCFLLPALNMPVMVQQ